MAASSEDLPSSRIRFPALDPSISEMLTHISGWRQEIARNVVRNNPELRSKEISWAVNRVVFTVLLVWIAQDRRLIGRDALGKIFDGPEPYTAIREIIQLLANLWDIAEPDKPVKDPVVDDHVIRKILDEIRIEDSRGPGDLLTVDLAYLIARYLDRAVRKSGTHFVEIINSRESAEGNSRVNLPLQLQEYFVSRSLRLAASRRARREILPIRLLDPSCGTGSVLITAYRQLITTDKGQRRAFEERKEGLLESIYGVDNDSGAVIATRFLLFLTLCENETSCTLPGTFFGLASEVFAGLRHTIRWGNTVVDPGIAREECWAFTPERKRREINPFGLNLAFPEIAASGGFDVVISNFPQGHLIHGECIQEHLQRNFSVYTPTADYSAYLIEQSLRMVRVGGVVGFITHSTWLRGKAGGPIRELLGGREIREIVVITGEGPEGCFLAVLNRRRELKRKIRIATIRPEGSHLDEEIEKRSFPVDPQQLSEKGWVFRDTRKADLLEKLARRGTLLNEIVMGQLSVGIHIEPGKSCIVSATEKDDLVRKDPRMKVFFHPVVTAEEIEKYHYSTSRFAITIPSGWTDAHKGMHSGPWRWFKTRHPEIARLMKTTIDKKDMKGHWWETEYPVTEKTPIIVFPLSLEKSAFANDPKRGIPDETVGLIGSGNLYLLGLLNSLLFAFILKNSPQKVQSSSLDAVSRLPVYMPDLDDPKDRRRHDMLVRLVARRIEAQNRLLRSAADHQQTELSTAKIDSQINSLVFELYDLTSDEIVVVKNETV